MDELADALRFMAQNFKAATAQGLKGNYVADTIRHNYARAVFKAANRTDFLIKGAPSEGKCADVPWIGLFNPEITSSAT